MEFHYLWLHEPILSAPPVECLKHNLYEDGDTVCEMAVFKLENDKFCFVKFLTEDKNTVECGLTDIEESETQDSLFQLFDDLNWSNK